METNICTGVCAIMSHSFELITRKVDEKKTTTYLYASNGNDFSNWPLINSEYISVEPN